MKRTDRNQSAIIKALRAAHCTVIDLSAIGRGCGDILAGRMGKWYMLEIKTEHGKPNKRQHEFAEECRGHYAVVRSVDEALEVVGL